MDREEVDIYTAMHVENNLKLEISFLYVSYLKLGIYRAHPAVKFSIPL